MALQTSRSSAKSTTAGCNKSRCPSLRVHRQHAHAPRVRCSATDGQSANPSSQEADQAASKPLSPASPVPNISGVSVQGFSPTSMQGWTIVKQTLRDANVKMLSAQEVVFAQERGIPIIDVRPQEQYEKGHIPGAVSVPFFQPISGWEPSKVIRRVGFALFGVFNGTEANPNFVADAKAAVDPQKGAILYCSIGGTLDASEGNKKGLQSRSLIAAWQLVSTGCNNLSVMKGGYSEWVGNGRDIAVFERE